MLGKVAMGVHVPFDKITSLEKSVRHWEGIVSLAIFVPVSSLGEGLTQEQRFVMD